MFVAAVRTSRTTYANRCSLAILKPKGGDQSDFGSLGNLDGFAHSFGSLTSSVGLGCVSSSGVNSRRGRPRVQRQKNPGFTEVVTV